MLSFFSKKTKSPDTPPEEIQGQSTDLPSQNNGDDFIFVEKRHPEGPAQPAMYPPMPLAPYGTNLPYPGARYPPGNGAAGGATPAAPVNYVEGIPFELAPQLSTKSTFEVTQLQVDGILAMMTRQMSVEEQEEYNFTLERSVQNECY